MLDNYLVGTITVTIGLMYFFLWTLRAANRWSQSSSANRAVSGFCILGWLLSRSATFELRSDAMTLVQEGLSSQNLLQVGVVTTVGVWAAILLLTRTVTIANLVTGPRLWVSLLIGVFSLSTIWSIWPSFTVYRSCELVVLWVLSVHYFSSSKDPLADLMRVVLWSMIFSLLGSMLTLWDNWLSNLFLFGALRSNTGGLLAAVYSVYLIHQWRSGRSAGFWHIALTAMFMFMFGSMSSWIIFAIVLPLFWWGGSQGLQRMAGTVFLLPITAVLGWFAVTGDLLENNLFLDAAASIFGKEAHHLQTGTGRLPLWTSIFEETTNMPFGQGYGAAERLLSNLMQYHNIGFNAYNAHNGYLSAWLGAGWLGLVALVLMLAAVWVHVRRIDPTQRNFAGVVLVVLILNNFTVAGLGGAMGPVWLIAMGLSVLPLALRQEATSADDKYPASAPSVG
jgi:O-antigen ligase